MQTASKVNTIIPEHARAILRTLSDNEAFYVKDERGRVLMTIRSLEAFADALQKMPYQSFNRHHFRGDFQKWLAYLVPEIADEFSRIRTKKRAAEFIRHKFMYLRNIALNTGGLESILNQQDKITLLYGDGSEIRYIIFNLIKRIPNEDMLVYLNALKSASAEEKSSVVRMMALDDVCRTFYPEGAKPLYASKSGDIVMDFASIVTKQRGKSCLSSGEIRERSKFKPLEFMIRELIKPMLTSLREYVCNLEKFYSVGEGDYHPFAFYEFLLALDLIYEKAGKGVRNLIFKRLQEKNPLKRLLEDVALCFVEERKVYKQLFNGLNTSLSDNDKYKSLLKILQENGKTISLPFIDFFMIAGNYVRSGLPKYRRFKNKMSKTFVSKINDFKFEFEELSKLSHLVNENLGLVEEIKKKRVEIVKWASGQEYASRITEALERTDWRKNEDFNQRDINFLENFLKELKILASFYTVANLKNVKKLLHDIHILKANKATLETLLPYKMSIRETALEIARTRNEVTRLFNSSINETEIRLLDKAKKDLHAYRLKYSKAKISRKTNICNLTCLTKAFEMYSYACTQLEQAIIEKENAGLEMLDSLFKEETCNENTKQERAIETDISTLEKALEKTKTIEDLYYAFSDIGVDTDRRIMAVALRTNELRNKISRLESLKKIKQEIQENAHLLSNLRKEILGTSDFVDGRRIERLIEANEILKTFNSKYDSYSNELKDEVLQYRTAVFGLHESIQCLVDKVRAFYNKTICGEVSLSKTDIKNDIASYERKLRELYEIKPAYDRFVGYFSGTSIDAAISSVEANILELNKKQEIYNGIASETKEVLLDINNSMGEKIELKKPLSKNDKEKIQLIGHLRKKIACWVGKYAQYSKDSYLKNVITGKDGFDCAIISLENLIQSSTQKNLGLLNAALEEKVEPIYRIEEDRKSFKEWFSMQQVLDTLYSEFMSIGESVGDQMSIITNNIQTAESRLNELDSFERCEKTIKEEISLIDAKVSVITSILNNTPSTDAIERIGRTKECLTAWEGKYKEEGKNKYLSDTVEEYDARVSLLKSRIQEKVAYDLNIIDKELKSALLEEKNILSDENGLRALKRNYADLKSLLERFKRISSLYKAYNLIGDVVPEFLEELKQEETRMSSKIVSLENLIDLKYQLQEDIKIFARLKRAAGITKKTDIKKTIRLLLDLHAGNKKDVTTVIDNWYNAFDKFDSARAHNFFGYFDYRNDSYIRRLVSGYGKLIQDVSVAEGLLDELRQRLINGITHIDVSKTANLDKAIEARERAIAQLTRFKYLYANLRIYEEDKPILKIAVEKYGRFVSELLDFEELCKIRENISFGIKEIDAKIRYFDGILDSLYEDKHVQKIGKIKEFLSERKERYREHSENRYIKGIVRRHNSLLDKLEKNLKRTIAYVFKELQTILVSESFPRTNDLDRDASLCNVWLSTLQKLRSICGEYVKIGEEQAKPLLERAKNLIGLAESTVIELAGLTKTREQINNTVDLLEKECTNLDNMDSPSEKHNASRLVALHGLLNHYKKQFAPNHYLNYELLCYKRKCDDLEARISGKIKEIKIEYDEYINSDRVVGNFDLEEDTNYVLVQLNEIRELMLGCKTLAVLDVGFDNYLKKLERKASDLEKMLTHLRSYAKVKKRIVEASLRMPERHSYITLDSFNISYEEDKFEKHLQAFLALGRQRRIVKQFKTDFCRHRRNRYLKPFLEKYQMIVKELENHIDKELNHIPEFMQLLNSDIMLASSLFKGGISSEQISVLNRLFSSYNTNYVKTYMVAERELEKSEVNAIKVLMDKLKTKLDERKAFATNTLDAMVSNFHDAIWQCGHEFSIANLKEHLDMLEQIKTNCNLIGHDAPLAEIEDKIRRYIKLREDGKIIAGYIKQIRSYFNDKWLTKTESLDNDFDILQKIETTKKRMLTDYEKDKEHVLVKTNLRLISKLEKEISGRLVFATEKADKAFAMVKEQYQKRSNPPNVDFDLIHIDVMDAVIKKVIEIYKNLVKRQFDEQSIEEYPMLYEAYDFAVLLQNEITALKKEYETIKQAKEMVKNAEEKADSYFLHISKSLSKLGHTAVSTINELIHNLLDYATHPLVRNYLYSPYIGKTCLPDKVKHIYDAIYNEHLGWLNRLRENGARIEEQKETIKYSSQFNLFARYKAVKKIKKLKEDRIRINNLIEAFEQIDYKSLKTLFESNDI